MRKSQYVEDCGEAARAGLDLRVMPRHPDGAPPSPPPPLRYSRPAQAKNPYFVWNPWEDGKEPVQHTAKPDSTIPAATPQTREEFEADVTNRIRIARRQSDATQFTQLTTPRGNSNQTGCSHFGGRATPNCPSTQPCGHANPGAHENKKKKFTGTRIIGPIKTPVKDRLGTRASSSGAQPPEEDSDREEEKERDPKGDPAPEEMPEADLLREVLRWRSMFKQETQRRPVEEMSHLDLLKEVLRWRNSKKLKKSSGPEDDTEGRQ
jgi:hypothetical protein